MRSAEFKSFSMNFSTDIECKKGGDYKMSEPTMIIHLDKDDEIAGISQRGMKSLICPSSE